MGRKLDALLGRTLKAPKLKPIVSLAISRVAILKNQRQVRCSQARSDVVQLLQLGHHERALLRVEHVIKEQNMFDVFVMIEGYCNLVIERVHLIEQERVCPEELREPLSSLLYAASRCGDFPELQEIRAVFTSRFGKEFVARAVELRNNCGVNPKMIQKLSTKQPNLDSRMKVLKEIASEINVVLQLEEASSVSTEENLDVNKKQNEPEPNSSANSSSTKVGDTSRLLPEEREKDDGFSDSTKTRRKYKDVADAAQAAFESAAQAAAAARAAVELSRSGSHDPDDQDSSNTRRGKFLHRQEPEKLQSDSENEEMQNETQAKELKQDKNATELERSTYASTSDSAEDNINTSTTMFSDVVVGEADPWEKDLHFDESDNESGNEQSRVSAHNQIPSGFQAGLKLESGSGYQTPHTDTSEGSRAPRLNIEKGPLSVRTRQVRGY